MKQIAEKATIHLHGAGALELKTSVPIDHTILNWDDTCDIVEGYTDKYTSVLREELTSKKAKVTILDRTVDYSKAKTFYLTNRIEELEKKWDYNSINVTPIVNRSICDGMIHACKKGKITEKELLQFLYLTYSITYYLNPEIFKDGSLTTMPEEKVYKKGQTKKTKRKQTIKSKKRKKTTAKQEVVEEESVAEYLENKHAAAKTRLEEVGKELAKVTDKESNEYQTLLAKRKELVEETKFGNQVKVFRGLNLLIKSSEENQIGTFENLIKNKNLDYKPIIPKSHYAPHWTESKDEEELSAKQRKLNRLVTQYQYSILRTASKKGRVSKSTLKAVNKTINTPGLKGSKLEYLHAITLELKQNTVKVKSKSDRKKLRIKIQEETERREYLARRDAQMQIQINALSNKPKKEVVMLPPKVRAKRKVPVSKEIVSKTRNKIYNEDKKLFKSFKGKDAYVQMKTYIHDVLEQSNHKKFISWTQYSDDYFALEYKLVANRKYKAPKDTRVKKNMNYTKDFIPHVHVKKVKTRVTEPLVCITNGTYVYRVSKSDAETAMLKLKGFTYTNKTAWKTAKSKGDAKYGIELGVEAIKVKAKTKSKRNKIKEGRLQELPEGFKTLRIKRSRLTNLYLHFSSKEQFEDESLHYKLTNNLLEALNRVDEELGMLLMDTPINDRRELNQSRTKVYRVERYNRVRNTKKINIGPKSNPPAKKPIIDTNMNLLWELGRQKRNTKSKYKNYKDESKIKESGGYNCKQRRSYHRKVTKGVVYHANSIETKSNVIKTKALQVA